MGQRTKIPWCDSTLNLLVGCDGCELSGACRILPAQTRPSGPRT